MRNPIPCAWRIPAVLIFLSLVPFGATTNRLIWLFDGDAAPDPAMDRFAGDWLMLAVHILSGSLFLILAAIQFSPERQMRHRSWHRGAGKLAMLAGVLSGLSGVLLVIAYPPSALATPLMDGVRIVFGAALAATITLAYLAIRRRDTTNHRAWMIRAFALGIAGTTQALVIGLWLAIVGALTPESATILITLGFTINIAIAEWRIRAGLSRCSSHRLNRGHV